MNKKITILINPYFTGWNMGERLSNVFPSTVYMDDRILEASKKIGRDRNIPVEV